MRSLGGTLLGKHFLGVSEKKKRKKKSDQPKNFAPRMIYKDGERLPMIRSDEEHIALLLAGFIDDTDGLVGSSNTLNGSFVLTSVANHVRRSEVVHDEFELALSNAVGHLLTDGLSAHLGVQVVGRNLWGWDHVADLASELLLNTTVEEESDVSVLLSLGNVTLLNILLAEPFSEHVTHVLRGESNRECVVGLILGHSGNVDVLRVREVGLRAAVVVTEQLGDFANTVRAVVEEEKGVIVCQISSAISTLRSVE